MNLGWRSLRGRRIMIALGLGLILAGFAGVYTASMPVERTITYAGPIDGSVVVGHIPGRVDWIGGGHISAQFNATVWPEEGFLFWLLEPDVFGSGSANCSISDYHLPWDRDLDIVLAHYGGDEVSYVSTQVSWRVTGFDPSLLLLSTVAFIAGLPVVAVGTMKKQKRESLAEFEKRVKL